MVNTVMASIMHEQLGSRILGRASCQAPGILLTPDHDSVSSVLNVSAVNDIKKGPLKHLVT